ncbi:hypothetical protein J1605_001371 [Eschrichtius robustus]|uniref:RING finger protein 121 n=1 Tax=Eschrichtius robustus TaxID=9764 RepID=A0AB34I5C9_ESCRO|nr:hypothetical protein J1605_001371 [Eschrichtius robustus]
MSDLSPEEQWRVEHARMHAKHRGHEAMHAEMVLILIATLVVAQLLLVQWKQRHPRSYNTLLAYSHLMCCHAPQVETSVPSGHSAWNDHMAPRLFELGTIQQAEPSGVGLHIWTLLVLHPAI